MPEGYFLAERAERAERMRLFRQTRLSSKAMRQMDVVWAGSISIVGGIATKLLDVNRRGRLARRARP